MKTRNSFGVLLLSIVFFCGFFLPTPLLSQVEKTYQQQQVHSSSELDIRYVASDSQLLVTIQVKDLAIINQITLCGLTLWVSPDGKKKKRTGISFPVGLPVGDRPTDPGYLQDVLAALPPVPMSVRMGVYEWTELGETRQGVLPGPQGLDATWENQNGVIVLQFFLPLKLIGYQAGKSMRLGWETGVLGRPDLSAWDGVGIYGINAANPSSMDSQRQRQRMQVLERYRALTIAEEGWTKKLIPIGE
ncbi:MAG: hypothetical protein NWR72_11380 [Bacteroidia bacterium]|nr:hypothetical protein [Bacteroidia bacterium]